MKARFDRLFGAFGGTIKHEPIVWAIIRSCNGA